MNRLTIAIFSLVAAYYIASPCVAADKMENPVYKSWAGFKKGTSVVYKSTSKIGDVTYESMYTYSLVEMTQDKAVVEMQVTVVKDGKEDKNRPMRLENPRSLNLPAGVKPDQAAKVPGVTEEGEEIVKLAGREIKAKWYKSKSRVEAGDTFTQSWSSDEVPGGLVKSIVTTPGNKSSMTMELVELK